MKNLLFAILLVLSATLYTGCQFPEEECSNTTNRQECNDCCIRNGYVEGDYEMVSGDCYCYD